MDEERERIQEYKSNHPPHHHFSQSLRKSAIIDISQKWVTWVTIFESHTGVFSEIFLKSNLSSAFIYFIV